MFLHIDASFTSEAPAPQASARSKPSWAAQFLAAWGPRSNLPRTPRVSNVSRH